MYVTGIDVQGLRALPAFAAADWERQVDLRPGPEGVALADALDLLVGSLDGSRTPAVLQRLGLAHPADALDLLEVDRLPEQFEVRDPAAVSAWVDLEVGRQATVRVTLASDPPFYGRLRDLAVREPRLVTALGEDPDVTIKAGWMWSHDLSAVAVGLSEVAVGGVAFPGTGPERPPWLAALLRDIGARLWRVDPREPIAEVSRRLYDASVSHDTDRRRRYERAAVALAGPPFGLGRLAWVRGASGVEARFGDALLTARQCGVAAEAALRLVEAVHLRAPDVLVVDLSGASSAPALAEWLGAATHGDGATLEQVIRIGGAA